MEIFDSTDRIGRIGEIIGSLFALAICALVFTGTLATVFGW